MTQLKVISINPGESTQAALHPELFHTAARMYGSNAYSNLYRIRDRFRERTDFLFGISRQVSTSFSSKILALRIIAAIGIATFGVLMLIPFTLVSWICMVMAFSIGLGMFTRVVSFTSICAFGFMFWDALTCGTTPEWLLIIPVIAGLFFAISGPGFYSIDQLTRRSMLRLHKSYERKRTEARAANRLSYKAFRYQ